MSTYERGKSFEQKVAGMIRRKADKGALRNAGSHANWHRRSDVFTYLPLHVECKEHKTVKIKEWFEQAVAAANGSQIPTVVFAKDEEVLVCLRFDDLLNLYAQVADLQAEIEELRAPINNLQTITFKYRLPVAEEKKIAVGAKVCRNGHLADGYGYCQQKGCPYSRGYRKPKAKK